MCGCCVIAFYLGEAPNQKNFRTPSLFPRRYKWIDSKKRCVRPLELQGGLWKCRAAFWNGNVLIQRFQGPRLWGNEVLNVWQPWPRERKWRQVRYAGVPSVGGKVIERRGHSGHGSKFLLDSTGPSFQLFPQLKLYFPQKVA